MARKKIDFRVTLEGRADPISLEEIANVLRFAPRMGAEKDIPEGSRYIVLSDTLANRLATVIEEAASHA